MATLVRGKAVICKVHDRHQVSVVDDGAVVIENGLVTAVGRYAEPSSARLRTRSEVHILIVPGFINSHHHVGLTPLQLGSPDLPLELWFASRLLAVDQILIWTRCTRLSKCWNQVLPRYNICTVGYQRPDGGGRGGGSNTQGLRRHRYARVLLVRAA